MRNTRTLACAGVIIMLTACTGTDITRYAGTSPAFQPEQFFSGKLTAHGVVKNRSGEVIRHFNADIDAGWQGGTGTLRERFEFNDGEIQYRTWQLVPNRQGGYTATAGDVIGPGRALTAGNAMNLAYTLQIAYKGGKLDLAVDDWMYRVSPDVVINESTLSKWGIRVGSIQLTILRTTPVGATGSRE